MPTPEDYANVTSELARDPDFLWGTINELRELWKAALEREGNLASAVADVVWKATQYGTTEDGDTFTYLVPKGAMHRLVGVAQSNGAQVPVAFRALSGTGQPEPKCICDGGAYFDRMPSDHTDDEPRCTRPGGCVCEPFAPGQCRWT